jgi:hypothetical protein
LCWIAERWLASLRAEPGFQCHVDCQLSFLTGLAFTGLVHRLLYKGSEGPNSFVEEERCQRIIDGEV